MDAKSYIARYREKHTTVACLNCSLILCLLQGKHKLNGYNTRGVDVCSCSSDFKAFASMCLPRHNRRIVVVMWVLIGLGPLEPVSVVVSSREVSFKAS